MSSPASCLLEAMRECGVSRIVFSSTAAAYGEPEAQPIFEESADQSHKPLRRNKARFRTRDEVVRRAYGLRYASLRYFNAAGATEKCGEDHDPETHIIPITLQAAAGKRSHVEIFGEDYPTTDGTCIRDYIHVIDLARAHILALEVLSKRSTIYNLGCGGEGYSVRDVIDTAQRVTGKEIPIRIGPRRAGDPASLDRELRQDKERTRLAAAVSGLGVIIESAWRWMQTAFERITRTKSAFVCPTISNSNFTSSSTRTIP